MTVLPLIFAMFEQLPAVEAGQLLLVIAIAFVIITLIASAYRFHNLVQLEEKDLSTIEAVNDYFFIQVTRYLSKINRTSSGFGLYILQLFAPEKITREKQEQVLKAILEILRSESDNVCLYREDCIGIIIDTEEENLPVASARLLHDLRNLIKLQFPEIVNFRIGASSFPMHGMNTQKIIDIAAEALEQADTGNPEPFLMAPPPVKEEDAEDAEGSEKPAKDEIDEDENLIVGELSKEDKNASLDPLTGVLKPAVIGSYMRKYLSEIRQKRKPAAVICIGVNRLELITKLYSEIATEDVIAGVSKIIQQLTRDTDLIGRYHFGDFLILAPCTPEQGELIATRIRNAVNKETFETQGRKIKTSVSAGISGYPNHGRLLRDLFRGAHTALEVVRSWDTSACLMYDRSLDGKAKDKKR
ncbi:MAG: diguanylate cyclase [Kiritimatiellales bacterium]